MPATVRFWLAAAPAAKVSVATGAVLPLIVMTLGLRLVT